jgi:hypothetical protein
MGATSLANVTCPWLAEGCCALSDALAARAITAVTRKPGPIELNTLRPCVVFIAFSLVDLTPDRTTLA